jgi:hypothetical protein
MSVMTYWIIRYVPDAFREEFQNIGVVCTDGQDWAVAFDWWYVDRRTHRDVTEWATWFQDQIAQRRTLVADHEFNRAWIEGIRERQANSIQLTAGRPASADSVQAAVALLFPRLVEHERPKREQRRTRSSLRSEMHWLYSTSPLQEGHDVFFSPSIRMGSTHGEFDALQTNESLPILRTVWAFDMLGLDAIQQSIQAWNYSVARMRRDGATLVSGSSAVPLSPDSVVTAVIDPPRHESARRTEVYESALEAWERERVDVLTLEQLAERIGADY